MGIEFGFPQIVSIAVIILLTCLVKTSIGVGSGIFFSAGLCLVIPPKVAIALGGPVMLISDILPMIHYCKKIDKAVFLILISGSVVGIGLGAVIMSYMPDWLFIKVVGFICGVFAVHQLVHNYLSRFLNRSGKKKYIPGKWMGVAAGLAGGVITFMVHTGGVVYSIYMLSMNLSKTAFVGTIVAIYFVADCIKNAIYWKIGLLTPDLIIFAFWMIPVMIAGSFAGYFIHKKLSSSLFEKLILAFVLVASIRLIFFS